MNQTIIIGRLTRDPEVTSGKKDGREWHIAKFGVAYNHRRRQGEEWVDEPHFFDVKAFGNLAKRIGERYSKGDLVLVEGRLVQERWETKEGEKRSKIGIVANRVTLIRTKGDKVEVEDTNGDEDVSDLEEAF